ncbi:hemerythrin domain-containing protein [Noviherbaspirillum autotrophicum]|uniref:Uncharacterized protein n=1 Tax=Noviherbaspirillum autotrophicum TaxID=709839 RepID=A0A0C2BTW4_9BURK|nr:hemerythrin domain-containing protein [Noviherbaspirillum autotrophicum]KIF81481.1 hypothetical protein TSA66_12770 [Noviherbaspirillum autotrophicum]
MKQASFPSHSTDIRAAQRIDIYAHIHKALRLFMNDTLHVVGAMDDADDQEVAGGLAQVRELTAFCRKHLQHENQFIHAAMEARRPGSAAAIAAEHGHHEFSLDRIEELASTVETSHGSVRAAAIVALYRSLGLFIADNLVHMHSEETENNAILWATHTDEEIIGIEQALVASIPPDESLATMRWMIAALSASERAEKLTIIRRHAPPPAFDALLGVARETLAERDWRKLADALGLADRMAA